MSSGSVQLSAKMLSLKSPRTVAKFMLVCLIVSSIFLTFTTAQEYADEKRDGNSRPFYMGSRYGRSGTKATVKVSGRGFYMGRYGKRTLPQLSPFDSAESRLAGIPTEALARVTGNSGDYVFGEATGHATNMITPMRCSFFGYGNLYKCVASDGSVPPSI